jgi:hypothetical protein
MDKHFAEGARLWVWAPIVFLGRNTFGHGDGLPGGNFKFPQELAAEARESICHAS